MKLTLLLTLLFIFMLHTSFMREEKYTMVCLGDSYTIGEAVKPEESFPLQTLELLKRKGIVFDEPDIIAKTGWTTDELIVTVKEKNLQSKFDFVTLLIGVNNQYRRRDIGNYGREFQELLKSAIEYAGGNAGHVYVISIPDWGVTPFGAKDKRGETQISMEIDRFNEVNFRLANLFSANYIEITKESRKAKTDPTLLTIDGLHPSGKMYKQWSMLLSKKIEENLSR